MLSSNVNGFKRVLVMLLCFCLVFTTVPVNFGYAETGGEGTEGTEVTNLFEGGSGTESDPYLIATKTQLDKVRENLSAHYQLTTNITFEESDFAEGGTFYNEGKGWLPIGSGSEAFTGSFDGSGFTIKNLYINSTENNVGLFACNEGSITNLGIVVASINTTATGEAKSGAVAGVNNGTIEKCYATGSLNASTTGENNYAGLIAGSNTGTIKNTYTIGNVETATATAVLAAGGVVGFNEGGLVENTYSLAICTTNDSSYAYKGAVAGYNLGGTMTNCYYVAEGQSSGKYATETKSSDPLSESGYEGFDFSTTWKIDNTKEYILPMLTDVDMEYENYSSGSVSIIGGNSIGNTLEAVLSEDTDEVTVVYVWTSEGNFVHVGKNFAVGSDMAAKTLTITAYGFNVAKSWTNSADITIKGVAAKPDAPIISSVTKNMVVLEEVEGLEYSKDGQNWQDSSTFTNLERNTEYTFYQRVKETDTCSYSETSKGTTVTTIIAETPEAPIVVATTNSSVELTPNDTYEYSKDGQTWQDSNIFEGLSPNTKYTFYQRVKETSVCGYSETSNGTAVTTQKNSIEKPEAPTLNYKSDVVVVLNEVKGCEYSIDGINWQESAVFEGLSAFTQYTFYQRYFENDTTYASEASEGFTVRTKTSAPDPVEPVLEKATETSITLVAVEGYEYSIDEGKTWQSSNIFDGLEPAFIYTFVQRFAEDPFTAASKKSEAITVKTLSATTVPEGYIGVYTKADLDAVRNNLDGKYILMNDIEFTVEDFESGGDYYNNGKGWSPIGSGTGSSAFSGVFNGNGYKISGLKMNSYSKYAGLFGYITGDIKNLGLEESTIATSSSTVAYAGGIAGMVDSGGSINNCYNAGSVSASSSSSSYYAYAGGIAGDVSSSGSISNCYNTGSVSASGTTNSAHAGGIAGDVSSSGSINNCYNTGSVSASASSSSTNYAYAGGIGGYVDSGSISNCYNTGSVSASASSTSYYAYAGGIAGYVYSNGSISNCYNTGSVSAESTISSAYAGGIAGYVYSNGSISNCYNTGSVSAESTLSSAYAGGIAGSVYSNGSISNCYNTGSVSASASSTSYYAYAGGIAGFTRGSISNCYNTGSVSASASSSSTSYYARAGGIAGDVYSNGSISNCYYLKGIGTRTYTGTTALSVDQMLDKSFYKGFDFDNVWTIDNSIYYKHPYLKGIDYPSTFNINFLSIEDIDSCEYTGTEIHPIINIKSGLLSLVEGEDFIISCENNLNVGKATITITGIGYYGGAVTKTFDILPATMEVTSAGYSGIYDAESHTITVTAPEDATVTYSSSETGEYTKTAPALTDAGTMTVYYKVEKDNYVTVQGAETIVIDRCSIDEEDVSIAYISVEYDGTAKEPSVTVEGLTADDYDVIYTDNVNVGTATVTVTGKGNYKGTLSDTFTINKQAYSSKFKASLSSTAYTYNGEKKTPSVTVYDAVGNKLVKDTDYTVKYSSTSRKKIGRYYATVTFKGNYSGSTKLYFTIGPKNPSSVKTTLYGYDDVKVSWSKVSGASGYVVYYKKSGATSYTKLKTTTSTSYKKSNLSDGAKYYFKVVAYKTVSGNKCYNAGKTSSIYTLKKVSGVKAAKSSSKVKISWTNIAGESGYQISQSTSKSKTNVVATYKTTSGKSKTISATKGKTYYYKVRAYKTVGDKKIYGPWSSVVKYKR